MAETRAAKQQRIVTWYREARAEFVRMSVGGNVLPADSQARWDLVNATCALAELAAEGGDSGKGDGRDG